MGSWLHGTQSFFWKATKYSFGVLRGTKKRYLLPAVRSERMDTLAMTEPGAGSDVRGMNCSAELKGGDWVENGIKHFISGADHADFIICLVATGEEKTNKV